MLLIKGDLLVLLRVLCQKALAAMSSLFDAFLKIPIVLFISWSVNSVLLLPRDIYFYYFTGNAKHSIYLSSSCGAMSSSGISFFLITKTIAIGQGYATGAHYKNLTCAWPNFVIRRKE